MAEATESTDNINDSDTAETVEEPGLTGMVLRDLALVFAAISIWAAADAWYVSTGLWFAQVVAIGDAIVVGLIIASLFHEWGHYAGSATKLFGATMNKVYGAPFFYVYLASVVAAAALLKKFVLESKAIGKFSKETAAKWAKGL